MITWSHADTLLKPAPSSIPAGRQNKLITIAGRSGSDIDWP
ncbi:hypothetical protein BXY51_008634 [Actinoplanes cyaneus]|nr:hypothetical protein [Actinoplanes cyaneus]